MGGEMRQEDTDQDAIRTFVAFTPLCNHCCSLFEKSVGGHGQARPDALMRSWNPDSFVACWARGRQAESKGPARETESQLPKFSLPPSLGRFRPL